jgi:hypothetical protein
VLAQRAARTRGHIEAQHGALAASDSQCALIRRPAGIDRIILKIEARLALQPES